MKMRKIIAVVLAAAQLAFGAVLISRGGLLDQREEERIWEIRYNGTPVLFELSYFLYYAEEDPPVTFSLKRADDAYSDCRYDTIITDEYGHSVIGPSYDTPPEEGLYLDNRQEPVYWLDADSIRTALADEDQDNHWYMPSLFGSGKFAIGGSSVRVFAVGYVYEGALVFTGMMIGDEIY